jgi:hypothetical protein
MPQCNILGCSNGVPAEAGCVRASRGGACPCQQRRGVSVSVCLWGGGGLLLPTAACRRCLVLMLLLPWIVAAAAWYCCCRCCHCTLPIPSASLTPPPFGRGPAQHILPHLTAAVAWRGFRSPHPAHTSSASTAAAAAADAWAQFSTEGLQQEHQPSGSGSSSVYGQQQLTLPGGQPLGLLAPPAGRVDPAVREALLVIFSEQGQHVQVRLLGGDGRCCCSSFRSRGSTCR